MIEAMLDLRRCLPPIFNISAKNFMIHPVSGDARIVLSDDMFNPNSDTLNLDRDALLYKSPEELLGEGKSLTTPFWVLGCLIFEAQYGINPFKTHLKPQVTESFIKFYPVTFLENQLNEPSENWKLLVLQLLIKSPLQRLGSDSFEKEILEHPYFTETE